MEVVSSWLESTEALVVIMPWVIVSLSIITLCFIVILLMRYRTFMARNLVTLEVRSPYHNKLTPHAVERLFRVLHGALREANPFRRIITRHALSLEISSTKSEGIRYYVVVDDRFRVVVERAIISHLDGVTVTEVGINEKNESTSNRDTSYLSFHQTGHFALPIKIQDPTESGSSMSYILNAINNCQDGESIRYQLIVCPGFVRNMNAITTRYQEYYKVSDATHNKAYSELFKTDIRFRIIGTSHDRSRRIQQIKAALSDFDITGIQTLRKRRFSFLPASLRSAMFSRRIPSLLDRKTNLLSSRELAQLYELPKGSDRVDDVTTNISRTLPAPSIMKRERPDSIIIGKNIHHGIETPLTITKQERERHMYVIGGTGSGKTTMLTGMIEQDMQNGEGLAVIDPHGDLADDLLLRVPEERIKDVIYFNPDDIDFPIGLNLLELPEGLDGKELEREKDLITESVVSIFRKLFSNDDLSGHRIDYILRNTIHTALTQQDATLFTVYDLINDPVYRKKVVKTLEDDNLKNFWRNEFAKAGSMQQVKLAGGITSKIGRFLFSASARRIIEQPQSTINFDEVLSSRKILICNFSKGLLGEDTSELFGIMVLAKLQLAALKRARQNQADRADFYLYVDEFQNFATPSFVQMLSEARKYRLFVTMAEQSTSQQDDQRMVNAILANAGIVVCFRTGNPADESTLLPIYSPFVEKGEVANLNSYNFYLKVHSVRYFSPVSGVTTRLSEISGSNIGDVRIMSRQNFSNSESDRATIKVEGYSDDVMYKRQTRRMLELDNIPTSRRMKSKSQ